MSASQPRHRTELTEDGELREVNNEPADQLSAVYCTNCGSANRAHSSFCRTCGASLDEQVPEDDYPLSRPKVKRSERLHLHSAEDHSVSASTVALEVMTLF